MRNLNIKPALTQAFEHVQNNLARVRAANPTQKIVIGFGERHDNPLHQLFIGAFLHRLRLMGLPHVFGTELAYNFAAQYINSNYAMLTPDEQSVMSLLDSDGRRSIDAFLLNNTIWKDGASRSSVLSMAREFRTPTVFNDLPCVYIPPDEFGDGEQISLDLSDPLVKGFIDEVVPNVTTNAQLNAEYIEGMCIRNAMMVRRLLNFMNDHNVSVAVQSTGINHLFGVWPTARYEHSLTQQFKEEGVVFIPIVLEGSSLTNLPCNRDQLPPETLIIDTLPKVYSEAFDRRTEEEDFIAQVAKASREYLPVVNKGLLTTLREDFYMSIYHWVKETRNVMAQPLAQLWYGPRPSSMH
jgi:hypothetical protein